MTKQYAAYNVAGYDNLMYLKEAVYEIAGGYNIQFELIETDMDLFSTDNAADKLAQIITSETKKAELVEILDCSQYAYVLESLDRDTNIFVREKADLYTGMKNRMAIDSRYRADHTVQLTRAATAQLMVDESMQQAIDAAVDARYLEITGNVLAAMGEWVAADCGEAHDVRIAIRLSWDTADGTGSQEMVFSDDVVAQVFRSNDGSWSGYSRMFSMVVTGFDEIRNLQAHVLILSGTNVRYVSSTGITLS